jgi:hypothetical protein
MLKDVKYFKHLEYYKYIKIFIIYRHVYKIALKAFL